ncbi:MAG: putative phage capsid protein [Pseudoduganella sp.]|jgi:HK97 family phage major capsid protein|nr:putative phage capsid protein [Pseudoduganella sp.]
MSKLAQLREQRDLKAKAANELNNKYPADQRMPSADAEKLDQILAEVTAIDSEISRELKLVELAGQDPQAQHEALLNKHTKEESRQSDESRGLRAFLTGGLMNMSQEDRNRIIARQTPDIRAAMSTTTPAEGGYTTAPEYQKALEQLMKAYGGMRAVATRIQTGTGTQMNFPTTDATAEEGEIVAQNTAVTGLDTTFGNTTLDVYKYSSKKIALPFELIQDSFIDIEGYIRELLAMRLGRIGNKHHTIGTGSSQPRGIVTASTVGKTGTTGQTLTVTYDDLVDLEHSVDPAYRGLPGVGFMMHDSSLKVVRKLKDSQNRPIFVPGYEQGNPGGAPDRLLGRPIYINQDMPVMAANAKSILFGAYSKYLIRDVMDLTLFRMTDSAFTLLGQVGFVAFQRMGGNLVDAGGAVRHYANSAS